MTDVRTDQAKQDSTYVLNQDRRSTLASLNLSDLNLTLVSPSTLTSTSLKTSQGPDCLVPSSLFTTCSFTSSPPGHVFHKHLSPPKRSLPTPGWFHRQPDNRRTLIHWMDKICSQMRFTGSTFALAVLLLDSLSASTNESTLETRLIALVCLTLASKLHEPQNGFLQSESIFDFFDGKFSMENIFRCERFVFAQLQFNLRRSTVYESLCTFFAIGFVTSSELTQLNGRAGKDTQVSQMELMGLELYFRLLVTTETNQFGPKQTAAAILSFLKTQLGLAAWSAALTASTGYCQSDFQDCLAIVDYLLDDGETTLVSPGRVSTFTREYANRNEAVPRTAEVLPTEETTAEVFTGDLTRRVQVAAHMANRILRENNETVPDHVVFRANSQDDLRHARDSLKPIDGKKLKR